MEWGKQCYCPMYFCVAQIPKTVNLLAYWSAVYWSGTAVSVRGN